MSKKLYSTSKWKLGQQIRQRRRAKRKRVKRIPQLLTRALRLKIANTAKPYKIVVVPEIYSLLRNEVEVIRFINKVRTHAEHQENVQLRFDDVSDVGIEAIAMLVATMEFYFKFSRVRGNLPNDPKCREIIVQSDFLSRTNAATSVAAPKSGRIAQRTSNRVAPDVARDLIQHGTQVAFGTSRRCQAAQRALLEGMQNTYDHADKKNKGEESWMAMVYADAAAKRVSFVLVDSGVGIFKSVRINKIRSVLRTVGIEKNTDVLRDILARRIPSSTGLPYRGRGLPSFQDAVNRGTLKNVTFVSNNVFANINSDDYRELPAGFDGTLLYWEIEG